MEKTIEQKEFINQFAFGTESLDLRAVAGSGKTTTIMMALDESLVPPSETLLLAFNSKIKEELAKRAPPGTVVLTLNGLGHRAWGKHIGKRLVLDAKKVGKIVSDLCRDSSDRQNHDYLQGLWPDIKELVNKAKGVGLLPPQFINGKGLVHNDDGQWERLADLHSIEFNADILRLAKKALITSTLEGLQGNIDFDDQLYLPACFRANFTKYPLVIIDEAQDLSEIQHFLIRRCVGGRLVLVGDPHQAIYGFRGAHASSMDLLGESFGAKTMSLTYTFRCSKAATAKAQKFVPEIKAANGNAEGSVKDLGLDWEPKDLVHGSAVLCRNIAPLVKLGMKCIKLNIPAYVSGRDIGAPLIKACKHLDAHQNLFDAIVDYGYAERIRAKGNLETISRVNDVVEALLAVMEIVNVNSATALEAALQVLFKKDKGSIVLSTIHRAKGLEWDCVYLLDAWRIPQKWILRAIKESPEAKWMLQQEHNLHYIAVTRTKDKLFFINYPEHKAEAEPIGEVA